VTQVDISGTTEDKKWTDHRGATLRSSAPKTRKTCQLAARPCKDSQLPEKEMGLF
jgi:hypothetical protein